MSAYTQEYSQIFEVIWTLSFVKKEKKKKEARLEGGKRNKGKLEERKMVIDIPSFCLDVLII